MSRKLNGENVVYSRFAARCNNLRPTSYIKGRSYAEEYWIIIRVKWSEYQKLIDKRAFVSYIIKRINELKSLI